MYVDDIVLLAENKTNLQSLLEKLNEWSLKWKNII